MASVIWVAFAGLLLAAAVTDARSYKIPNWISIALVVLFIIAVLASGQPALGFWPHVAAGLAVLAVGYILYMLTGMGAGDAKLAAAGALWSGVSGLYMVTLTLAVSMAALAFSLVALRRLVPAASGGGEPSVRMLQRGAPVPLGIALSAAMILASWQFDPALWAF
jgi:prepilin peptidase CpaA